MLIKKGKKKVNSISYKIKKTPISKKFILIDMLISLKELKPHS
jgi:hypothetical protein